MAKFEIGNVLKVLLIVSILPTLTAAFGTTVPGLDLINGILPLLIIIPLFEEMDFGEYGNLIKPLIMIPMVLNIMNGLGFTVLDSQTVNLIQTMVIVGLIMKIAE